MLLIKAKGGLGNRMLSAASAIVYANATERRWYIDWTDGIYANKPYNAYSLMFNDQNQMPRPQAKDFSSIIPHIWSNKLDCSPSQLITQFFSRQHSNPLVYRKMSTPFTAHANVTQLEVFWSYTSKFGRVRPFLTRYARDRDAEISKVLKQHFQPCNTVKNQVDSLINRSEGNILGVHIRYTDLKVPIQKVLDTVKKQIMSGGFSTVFLATDSEYAQDLFQQKIPNVLVADKQFSENNDQLHTLKESDVKLSNSYAALVDMMMLSKCQALVYCSRSTFSETSRLLGSFEKGQLFDLDRFNVHVRLKNIIQEFL